MKKCRCCGVEIVNGENGCMMAGDVCFDCKPWNMSMIPARRRTENGIDWEGMILARQEVY